MTELIDFYNGIIKFNGTNVEIIIDPDNTIWFYGNKIAKLLGYKDRRRTISSISHESKTKYENIKGYSKYKFNVQDHAIFVNETGLYDLTLKSKKKIAQKFRSWLTKTVIPSLRKYGSYELNKTQKYELDQLNNTLDEYKKRVKILEHNQKKERYPEGGYIYIIQLADATDNLYKIGKTDKDLNKRLNTYNTTTPNKVIVIDKLKVESPTAIELCVKGYLHKYRYINDKEYYNVDPKTIMKIIKHCAETIESNKKIIKRHQPNIKIEPSDIPYGIMAVTKEEELENVKYEKNNLGQFGGADNCESENKTLDLYRKNKINYLFLCNNCSF